jgi:hypothetical protein
MSALGQKLTSVGHGSDVGYGPEADIALFDHIVGAGEQRRWNVETESPFADQGPHGRTVAD